MYNEKDYGFNWVGLFIKVVIIVILILIVVWLFTKVFFSYSKKDLKNDLNRMKVASEKYFTEDNLPQEEGKSKILTLNEMLKEDLIKSKTIDECDKEQSYAKATRYQDYSLIKVELVCSNKKDSTTVKLDNNGKKVKTEDKETTTKEETKETTKNNSKTNNKSNSKSDSQKSTQKNSSSKTNTSNSSSNVDKNSNTTTTSGQTETVTKTLYYEFAKIKTQKVTRKKANYCELVTNSKTYYSLANDSYNNYIKKSSFTYTVRVSGIPEDAKNITINNIDKFYTLNQYYTYVNERNKNSIMWTGGNNNGGLTYNDAKNYLNHSTTNGYNANINYNNTTNIITITINKYSTDYSVRNDGNVFMPVKFDINYQTVNKQNCITDNYDNRYNYPNYEITGIWSSTTYEESGLDYNNTTWSTSSVLNGYKPTGKTEYR